MASGGVLSPQILGPHPGLSILRIWQGIVEVTLRIALAVCSLCTLAFSASVMNDVAVGYHEGTSSAKSLGRNSKAAGLFVICFAGLAVIIEVFILVLRFLNIGVINLRMKKFFIVDITISVVLVVGYVAVGLTQTVYANRWREAPASCSVSGTLCRDQNWWKVTTAAAVGGFTCAVLAAILSIWSFLFLVKRWYYKMLQYISLP